MIGAKQKHIGQKSNYSGFFAEWQITTDCSKADTVKWCFDNLDIKPKPEHSEWLKKIKNEDGSKNWSYYYAGYYTIKKIPDGFLFTVYAPHAE